jgi:tetratricopeptide (TPR) repeat protein
MNKRQLIALQWGMLAIVAAVLFPPYGYERVVFTVFPPPDLAPSEVFHFTNSCPWKYAGHAFILSPPPTDKALDNRIKDIEAKHPQLGKTYTQYEMKIAGHVLAAEIAGIALLTAGVFIMLGYKRKSPASTSAAEREDPAVMKGSLIPEDAKGWYNLGVAYLESGRTEEAIAAYQQAIQIKPNDAETCYALGFAYENSARTEEAIAAYGQAVKIKPDFADAWHNLGVNYRQLGKTEEAAKAFQRARELDLSLFQ